MKSINAVLCCATLSAMTWLPACAQARAPLDELDRAAIMADIEGMLSADTNHMHLFEPKYATPARMAQFVKTPEFLSLRRGKSSALALVGKGPDVLSFDKPSDVWSKLSTWFPVQVQEWRQQGGMFRADIELYGPLPGWHPDAMAFVSLWNCSPQLIWWNHDRNPFALGPEGRPDLVTRSAPDNDAFRYDFAYCLTHDNGRNYAFPDTAEDKARIQRFRTEVLQQVTPVLVDKLAHHLRRHRCTLTGPDDCVLSLRLWSEIAPQDPNLALALQDLEADVAPDAPLPALRNPSTDLWRLQESDGSDRYNAARRNAAYLRAKLASMSMAPASWRREQVQYALRQLSALSAVFSEPFVTRFRSYAPGYYSKALSPFDMFYKYPDALPIFQDAIVEETRRLGLQAPCETLTPWFFHDAIQIQHVLDGLRAGTPEPLRCGEPSMAWLTQQTTGPNKSLLYGLLAILPYIPQSDRQVLQKALASPPAHR